MALFGETRVVPVVEGGGGKLIALSDADSLRNAAPTVVPKPKHTMLGQFLSTSITGNDLLSSCLYTAGIAAGVAGPLAPVCLATVALLLYCYRYIYAEVVTAIPVNGGSYNGLLNVTSKKVAASAACLSLLTYCATAVVSGVDSMQYLQVLWPALDVRIGTVVVLAIFAALSAFGVGESSFVALSMFALHLVMMVVLTIYCIVWASNNGWVIFVQNWHEPFPDISDSVTGAFIMSGNVGTAIIFGYASATLGITGFETAANFVEEMTSNRIYIYTLRNLWILVSVFNPVLSLVAMGVMPLSDIYTHPSDLLAEMGRIAGGDSLRQFVCIDAVIVLAGAVLTSYVGIIGLGKRLGTDGVLPAFLMKVNKLRGTPHFTILAFFLLCTSLFLAIFDPNNPASINALGAVYSLAFLSVMFAFGICCVLLKVQRPELPRLVVASWPVVFSGMALVLTGLIADLILGPSILKWFAIYLAGFGSVIIFMFMRVRLLRLAMWIVASLSTDKASRDRHAARVLQLRAAHDVMEQRKIAAAQQAPSDAFVGMPAFFGDAEAPVVPRPLPLGPGSPTPLGKGGAEAVVAPVPPAGDAPPQPPIERRLSMTGHVAAAGRIASVRVVSAMSKWLQRAQAQRASASALGLGAVAPPDAAPPAEAAAGATAAQPAPGSASTAASHDATPSARAAAAAAAHEAATTARGVWEELAEPVKRHAPGTAAEAAGGAAEGALPLPPAAGMPAPMTGCRGRVYRWLQGQLDAILTSPVVFLAKTNDLHTLSDAIGYVRTNELSRHIIMVNFVNDLEAVTRIVAARVERQHRRELRRARAAAAAAAAVQGLPSDAGAGVADSDSDAEGGGGGGGDEDGSYTAADMLRDLPPLARDVRVLQDNAALLDTMHTDITIDSLVVRGSAFSPAAIAWLAEFLAVTPGMILMSSPDVNFPFQIATLGGVRVITRSAPRAARVVSIERLRTVVAHTAQDMGIAPSGGRPEPLDRARVTAAEAEVLGALPTAAEAEAAAADASTIALLAGLGNDTTFGGAAARQAARRREAAAAIAGFGAVGTGVAAAAGGWGGHSAVVLADAGASAPSGSQLPRLIPWHSSRSKAHTATTAAASASSSAAPSSAPSLPVAHLAAAVPAPAPAEPPTVTYTL